jgi:hypothetical protein
MIGCAFGPFETFTLVVWLAGTTPIGICNGMGTGIPTLVPDLFKRQCEQMLAKKPGVRAMCVNQAAATPTEPAVADPTRRSSDR